VQRIIRLRSQAIRLFDGIDLLQTSKMYADQDGRCCLIAGYQPPMITFQRAQLLCLLQGILREPLVEDSTSSSGVVMEHMRTAVFDGLGDQAEVVGSWA